MNFRPSKKITGTSLQGYVFTTYNQLVEIFGLPHKHGSDKTTVEWGFQFADGTVATIYDWKTNCTPKSAYDWHIGGNSKKAVLLIEEALRNFKPAASYEPNIQTQQFEKLLRKARLSLQDINYLQGVLLSLVSNK